MAFLFLLFILQYTLWSVLFSFLLLFNGPRQGHSESYGVSIPARSRPDTGLDTVFTGAAGMHFPWLYIWEVNYLFTIVPLVEHTLVAYSATTAPNHRLRQHPIEEQHLYITTSSPADLLSTCTSYSYNNLLIATDFIRVLMHAHEKSLDRACSIRAPFRLHAAWP